MRCIRLRKRLTNPSRFLKNVRTWSRYLSEGQSWGTLLQTILIETKEVLPSYYWKTKETSDNVLITDELRHDLNRIYDLLIRYGVTSEEISAYHKIPLKELYQDSPTMEFLNRLD